MMGHSHAIMGATIYAALTLPHPLGLDTTHQPLTLTALGALAAAGAALVPDWDHPQATISRALPPVSNLAARGISAVSGGHRHGTHALPAMLAAIAVTIGVCLVQAPIGGRTVPLGAAVLMCVLAAGAAKALHLLPRHGYLSNWAVGLAAAAALIASPTPMWWWMPLAVGIGYGAHLVGDAMTTGLIRPLLPLRQTQFGLAVLGDTGSWREHLLTTALSLYLGAGLYVSLQPFVAQLSTPFAL